MASSHTLIPASPNWYGAHLTATPSSNNSPLIAICAHNSILILDSRDGQIKTTLSGHTNRTTAVACTSHNSTNTITIVSAALDRTIRIWSVIVDTNGTITAPPKQIRVLPKRSADVKAISIDPTGSIAIIGDQAGNLINVDLLDSSRKISHLQTSCHTPISCIDTCPSREHSSLAAIGTSAGIVIIDWKRDALVGRLPLLLPDATSNSKGALVQTIKWMTCTPVSAAASNTNNTTNATEVLVATSADGSIAVFKHMVSQWDFSIASSDTNDDDTENNTTYPAIESLFQLIHGFQSPNSSSNNTNNKQQGWTACQILPYTYSTKNEYIWILTSGSSTGTINAWKVPLAGYTSSDVIGPYQLPSGHTRTVFTIDIFFSPSLLFSITNNNNDDVEELTSIRMVTTSMDRCIIGWTIPEQCMVPSSSPSQWNAAGVEWSTPSLGGHIYSLDCLVGQGGKIVIGCGDKTIRTITFEASSSSSTNHHHSVWQGIPDKVTAVAWHPHAPTVVAFGCHDGSVGLCSSARQGTVIILPVVHQSPVVGLSWTTNESSSTKTMDLVSFSTNGSLLGWSGLPHIDDIISRKTPATAQGWTNSIPSPIDIGSIILSTTNSSRSISAFSASKNTSKNEWAVGITDGAIILCSGHGNLLAEIKPPPALSYNNNNGCIISTVYVPIWVSCYCLGDSNANDGVVVAAVFESSREAHVLGLYGGPGLWTGTVSIEEAVTALVVTKTSSSGVVLVAAGLTSGNIALYTATRCTDDDGTMSSLKRVGTLQGHSSTVLSLAWLPPPDDSASHDDTYPRLLSGGQDQSLRVWNNLEAALEETTTNELSLQLKEGLVLKEEETEDHKETVQPTAPKQQPSSTSSSKSKRAVESVLGSRSIVSDILHHYNASQPLEALQQACISLATTNTSISSSSSSSSNILLGGCWKDQPTASEALKQASTQALSATNVSAGKLQRAQRAAALALWRGDTGTAIHILVENDALTADFVSMAASAGRQAWEHVVQVYAAQMEAKNEPHLAALHLLSIGRVVEAVLVYTRAGLLSDAVSLASARLIPGDAVLEETHAMRAGQLLASGQVEQAAGHYILSRQWGSAVRALKARGSQHALQAAKQLCEILLTNNAGDNLLEIQQELELLQSSLVGVSDDDVVVVDESAQQKKQEPPPPPPLQPDTYNITLNYKQRYTKEELLQLQHSPGALQQWTSPDTIHHLPSDLVRG